MLHRSQNLFWGRTVLTSLVGLVAVTMLMMWSQSRRRYDFLDDKTLAGILGGAIPGLCVHSKCDACQYSPVEDAYIKCSSTAVTGKCDPNLGSYPCQMWEITCTSCSKWSASDCKSGHLEDGNFQIYNCNNP